MRRAPSPNPSIKAATPSQWHSCSSAQCVRRTPTVPSFTREELQDLEDLSVGHDQEEDIDMDQYLIAIMEGSQPSPQHQGSQVESAAQLFPCAASKEDLHSSAVIRDLVGGSGAHDQEAGEARSLDVKLK